MRPYELHADLPSLGLSLQDIQVISTIIGSYLAYLRRGVLPSNKRDTEIALLEGIQKRVLATVPAEDDIVPLTAEEIQALANALQSFASLTRQRVAQSAERDEVLKQMRAIRTHLLHMLTGKNK